MNTTPDTSAPAPANGAHTTNGIPHGSTSLTPHLVIEHAAEAIEFYRTVFGARVVDVTHFPGQDLVAHAALDFGHGGLTLSDPMPDLGLTAPDPARGHDYSMALYVPNVDEVVAAAGAAHAIIREPATTFVSGDRYASIQDPFGIRWSIMTRVEDLSEAESKRRVAEWAAQQS